MRMRECVAGAVALLVLVVSGCSEAKQTQPPAAQAAADTADSDVEANPYAVENPTSPPVSKPLVVAGVGACEAVTRSQLIELGLRPDSAEDHSNAETADCRWYSDDRQLSAQVALSNLRGLELVYYYRNLFGYFEPTDLAGYPAVRDTSPDAEATCEYLVGVGPNRGLSVDFDGPVSRPVNEYCALAQRLGAMVIGNLSPE